MTPQEQAAELYRDWWKIVQASFGLLSPSTSGLARAEGSSASDSIRPLGQALSLTGRLFNPSRDGMLDSTKPIAEALNVTGQLLTQLYGALIPSLGVAPADWQSWTRAYSDQFKNYLHSVAAAQKQAVESGWRALSEASRIMGDRSPFGAPWPSIDATVAHPHLEGLDRTFTALADAFGLGPSKALRDTWLDLIAADKERRKAQLDYFSVLGSAASEVVASVAARLSEMAARGEQVDSMMSWVRLWANVADKTVHEAMQSEAGLKATADYVRAALRYRQSRNRLIELVSELLNVPTRAELDEAYREIQQLKRQLRGLRRGEQQSPSKPRLAKPRKKPAKGRTQEIPVG